VCNYFDMNIFTKYLIILFPILLFSQNDFGLEDLNYNSETYQQTVGPSFFPNNVCIVYFGHEY